MGVYLAAVRRAEEEGYPEVALALRQVAWEEAEHATLVAERLGKVGATKDNLDLLGRGAFYIPLPLVICCPPWSHC